MDDKKKTKALLIAELEELRELFKEKDRRIFGLERSEKMLQETEERFRLMYEDAPIAY